MKWNEIQTEYSSLDNMSLYRYRLHKIDSWDVPKWSKFSLLGTCCMYPNKFLTISYKCNF